jgi:hypothetical protein
MTTGVTQKLAVFLSESCSDELNQVPQKVMSKTEGEQMALMSFHVFSTPNVSHVVVAP